VGRRGSSASGGKSGWRSRKVVLAVRMEWRSSWMSGRRPRNLAVLRALTLGRADDEVALDVGRQRPFGAAPRRVGFFIRIRASRVCSSHSSRGVFSLMLANGHPDLSEWGFELFPGLVWAWLGGGCGRGPACCCCCMVFARFSTN
jgi:hypothetical protein